MRENEVVAAARIPQKMTNVGKRRVNHIVEIATSQPAEIEIVIDPEVEAGIKTATDPEAVAEIESIKDVIIERSMLQCNIPEEK